MEYTILILALPVLSFLILGLTGMYMNIVQRDGSVRFPWQG